MIGQQQHDEQQPGSHQKPDAATLQEIDRLKPEQKLQLDQLMRKNPQMSVRDALNRLRSAGRS